MNNNNNANKNNTTRGQPHSDVEAPPPSHRRVAAPGVQVGVPGLVLTAADVRAVALEVCAQLRQEAERVQAARALAEEQAEEVRVRDARWTLALMVPLFVAFVVWIVLIELHII